MSLGLLRAAWRPEAEVCVIRAVARQREVLLADQASWVLRMQKALVRMNLQLTEVLTDVMGVTGQAIIRAIVAGERNPKVLASHRHGRVRRRGDDIARALTGNWRDEHLFVLQQALAMFDSLAQRVVECDMKIEALLAPLARHDVDLSGPGKRGSKNTPQFDARTALARWAGVDLTRINGLSVTTVMTILSEIGPDLSRFASVKHFCSWLGLCPGTKISVGKVLSARTRRSANRVRQALKLAAMSLSRNDSALGAFYRRLCARMDKPRANTAVAHKLARMVYFMLTRGEAFVDQGAAALRGTAAPAEHRGAQAPCYRAWLPPQPRKPHENVRYSGCSSGAIQPGDGVGVCGETGMRYTNERQRRDDRPTNGAHCAACTPRSEPAQEHGPGFVGDSGEQRELHPVREIESIATHPMALPLIHDSEANDGDAQARRQF
jgi:hypothetical protein